MICLIFLQVGLVKAQNPDSAFVPSTQQLGKKIKGEEGLSDLYSMKNLASLEVLMDRAVDHAASLDIQGEILNEQIARYKIEKRRWVEMFSLQASASYGTGTGLTAADNGTVVISRVTNETNLLYNGGLSLRINPETWVNRKQNLRILEAQMAQTQYNKEFLIQQLRELVIQRYQALQNSLSLVKLHAEAAETSRIAHETATLFFERGDMTIQDYDTSLRYKASAAAKFEKAKGEYRLAYEMLKEICGGNLRR